MRDLFFQMPSLLAKEVLGSLLEEPPRHGGRFKAQVARRGPARSLHRSSQGAGPRITSTVTEKCHGKGNPKVAKPIGECLSCLAFPESHKRHTRTTNGPERLSKEIKR